MGDLLQGVIVQEKAAWHGLLQHFVVGVGGPIKAVRDTHHARLAGCCDALQSRALLLLLLLMVLLQCTLGAVAQKASRTVCTIVLDA
jgi:hypothetical protein